MKFSTRKLGIRLGRSHVVKPINAKVAPAIERTQKIFGAARSRCLPPLMKRASKFQPATSPAIEQVTAINPIVDGTGRRDSRRRAGNATSPKRANNVVGTAIRSASTPAMILLTTSGMRSNDELERRARRRQDLPLYRSRARSKRLLCGMLAASPEADYGFLPPRVGFDSALGNGGTPKLRRSGYLEVAAHRARASCSGEKVPSCVGRGDRAPRIEAAPCDELSASDALLLLQLMRHNARGNRRKDRVAGFASG